MSEDELDDHEYVE